MDRREVLKMTSLLLGYSVLGTTTIAILDGCKADTGTDWKPAFFTGDEVDLIAEICDTILPKTDTPGAKDAFCHRWVDQVVAVFYDEEKKAYFKSNLQNFNKLAQDVYGKAFIALGVSERENILEKMVQEASKMKEETKFPHIFNMVKELTISGYCTSDVGAKGGLLDFRPVPGPYQGCIDYSTIGKAWAL